jgi:hypothetical protein
MFIDWAKLKNPMLEYPQWSIKDACCALREGVFHLFFSAFDEQRSYVASVSTQDFVRFSGFSCFSGQVEGHVGMCSPDIMQVDDGYVLTFNSWGISQGAPTGCFTCSQPTW